MASPSELNLPLNFLKLLGHDIRWQLLAALSEGDRRVQELVSLLERPQNLISYHLRLLRDGQIVQERRSSSDGRDVYYSLNLVYLQKMYRNSGHSLHPALADPIEDEMDKSNSPHPYRVLFLCTHNSARSQQAEGILRAKGGDRVEVFSAGNKPSHVHPLAVRAAAALNIDISQQRSKHMDEFTGQSFDAVITVCDKVREACPVFPIDTKQIHWSFPDPAEVAGSESERYRAFEQTARELSTRVNFLLMMIDRW